MEKKINRRQFIKKTGYAGALAAGSVAIPGLNSCSLFATPADIGIVTGKDYYKNTIKVVDMIGGIGKFVSEGAKVGLLINSDFEIPATFVNPDISLAVLKMVFDAGAAEVTCLQAVKEEYWQRSSLYDAHLEYLEKIRNVEKNVFPSEFNDTDFTCITHIPGGKTIKETEVVKAWLECDVFINIPISKHHATTFLTGALKNIMGVSTRKSNVYFHLADGKKNNPDHLSRCIVDQHLLKKTDLCIVDATEFITDNGPMGPGNVEKPMKVVAGSDVVAIDALCAGYLGYAIEDILAVMLGAEAGIGNMNYSELNVVEFNADLS